MKSERKQRRETMNLYRDALIHLAQIGNYELAGKLMEQYESEVGNSLFLMRYKIMHHNELTKETERRLKWNKNK